MTKTSRLNGKSQENVFRRVLSPKWPFKMVVEGFFSWTWKAEEDEELNKSRAFVELAEYIANAVENDTHFYAELHKLYSLHTKHTLCRPTSVSLPSLFWCHNLQLAVSGLLQHACFSFLLHFLTWT